MTADDLAAVLELERRWNSSPWTDENFRSELAKPYCQALVLTDDETDSRVFGYVVFWVIFEEVQILSIAVEPDSRGLGYGRRLIGEAVRAAIRAGMKRVTLDVRVSNKGAIALYEAAKFVISHVRKTFYSDGEDGYQMDLFIDPSAPPETDPSGFENQ